MQSCCFCLLLSLYTCQTLTHVQHNSTMQPMTTDGERRATVDICSRATPQKRVVRSSLSMNTTQRVKVAFYLPVLQRHNTLQTYATRNKRTGCLGEHEKETQGNLLLIIHKNGPQLHFPWCFWTGFQNSYAHGAKDRLVAMITHPTARICQHSGGLGCPMTCVTQFRKSKVLVSTCPWCWNGYCARYYHRA